MSRHLTHARKQLPVGSSGTARPSRTRMASPSKHIGAGRLLHMYLSFRFLLVTLIDNQLQSVLSMVDPRKQGQPSRLVDFRCRIRDQQSNLDLSVSAGGLENLFPGGFTFRNGPNGRIHAEHAIYYSAFYWPQSWLPWSWGFFSRWFTIDALEF
jgi:hypothetical protein